MHAHVCGGVLEDKRNKAGAQRGIRDSKEYQKANQKTSQRLLKSKQPNSHLSSVQLASWFQEAAVGIAHCENSGSLPNMFT